jgi:hypothetical protein
VSFSNSSTVTKQEQLLTDRSKTRKEDERRQSQCLKQAADSI